jgi:hypothetical protein
MAAINGHNLHANTAAPRQVTPLGLLGCALLACLAAALVGGVPLANWASGLSVPAAGAAADAWLGLMRRVELDRPYRTLRHAVRAVEAARFPGSD